MAISTFTDVRPAAPVARNSRELLAPLVELAARCPALTAEVVGSFASRGREYALHRFHFHGQKAEHDSLHIGVFAGLHGDEPAGIDGFVASEGLIQRCFEGVLSAPSHQRPQPFDLIFETPALAPLESQVEATLLAIKTVLVNYRVFLAHSINL